ncbi:Lrp/AsnC family transcriptional regulator [Roseitranquillus sediminis]|uniref:Lrp/AsnC family transcriptional regulator n=1 Tax=Roseitranquillus sediminis TaxID=2809051 RepID=UPI001D0C636D|nr:Lrp/AsnC family transcriptional regulator [Roseitranquillus sediminis]MBM9593957.1 Lrp/AsnC family transcriptional regulator [Roseitranquillus sediminis]
MPRLALDDRDIAILSVLTREGRIAKTELARRVNLSATPCWQRLRRLEQAGLIRGYRADVALAALGPHVVVFVTVELESHRAESFQAFERGVARYDEVVGCWALGGGYDYLIQVVTRDVVSYQALIDAMLAARIGLKRYFTYVVTKEVKTSPPPLDLIAGTPEKTDAARP